MAERFPHTKPTASARRADCVRIAVEAGELLRMRFGQPGEIQGKGVEHDHERIYDVVTEVDFLSEQLILTRIAELDAHALVLAEEGGLTRADRSAALGDVDGRNASEADELWLVDPIDGTINFAHSVPHFCVSVACWRRGEPLAGAIVDPMIGETFSFEWDDAAAGTTRAAYHDDLRIELGDGPSTTNSLLTIGGGGPSLVPLMRRFRSWRRLGSAALALAWVGVGRCGAYVQTGNLSPWDWAVGAPFVEAAGGVVTDGGGASWEPRLHGVTGVIAGSRLVHETIARQAAEADVDY
ncbi:MAG: suhB 2 [Thermoleophilia bacterium]|nr:suhB 2 [Thermoleophilia bacterium]